MVHNKLYTKYYFINNFDAKNLKKLDKNTCIIYRNYKNKIEEKKIRVLQTFCKKNFILLGSAHNHKEIKIKETQKIKLIFLSSLFKLNKNFLGINKFNKLSTHTYLNIIALGGINKQNQKKLKLTKCLGFAGISYFE